jgi:hypothetical protein
MALHWRQPHLPPLLRGLGTLLISASFFVEAAQRRPQAGPVDPQA